VLGPKTRKLVLTTHIVSSVGWLGAVLAVLALAIVGTTSDDTRSIRGVYVAMELTAWSVLVPLSLSSLLSGIVQSLGTKWGLFRHYWVVIKLAITLLATVVLLLYTETLDYLAGEARASRPDLELLRTPSVIAHAGVAVLLLITATVLAVYKPRGLTRHGLRKQSESRSGA
jgi:uncharacterized membrane protein